MPADARHCSSESAILSCPLGLAKTDVIFGRWNGAALNDPKPLWPRHKIYVVASFFT